MIFGVRAVRVVCTVLAIRTVRTVRAVHVVRAVRCSDCSMFELFVIFCIFLEKIFLIANSNYSVFGESCSRVDIWHRPIFLARENWDCL